MDTAKKKKKKKKKKNKELIFLKQLEKNYFKKVQKLREI